MIGKVSVITVCRNSADTIRETIESVLAQDYGNIEYILVDGNSSDATMDIVREYQTHFTHIVSEPDCGIYDAMNKGIRLATGDVIAMINSDDVYSDLGCIRRLVERLESTGADCVFADLVIVDREETEQVLRYYNSASFRPDRLRYGWMPAYPTMMIRRHLYKKVGEYSLKYRIAADFEMCVRLFHVACVRYVHLPYVVIRMRAGGISTKGLHNSWILNNEIVRACRANGLETSLPRVLLKLPMKLLEYVRRPSL